MTPVSKTGFNPLAFLAKAGIKKTRATYRKGEAVFSQGDDADAVFLIEKGKVKLRVVSKSGKEAVIALLDGGSFLGEECLVGRPLRLASAIAMSECSILRLQKATMIRGYTVPC